MRTPGHAVLNLLVVAPAVPGFAAAVVAGALVPDLPIAVLYAWERFARGTPEDKIWSEAYQRPFWQAVIHGAHSFPLTAAAGLASLALGRVGAAAFFASMFAHAVADVPVHGEDAHRHFIPLSNWRFVSPFSYWDVRRHARVVAAVEAVLVVLASAAMWPRAGGLARAAFAGVSLWYAHGYWRTFLRGDGQWQPYF